MIQMNGKLGPLNCRIIQKEDIQPDLVAIICHGYGAPGDDLVPIGAQILANSPNIGNVRFIFPEAPISLGSFYPGMESRAWWHIDVERYGEMAARGDFERIQKDIPSGLADARKKLLALIQEVSIATGLPLSKIVLGGFSQGAMLTTDVCLRLEEAPAALVLMSGTLICREEWEKRAQNRSGLQVLQSHGTEDPLLPFSNAEALKEVLQAGELEVDFVPFQGPHTVPGEMLPKFAQLLEKLK